jgi:hypothetical protein
MMHVRAGRRKGARARRRASAAQAWPRGRGAATVARLEIGDQPNLVEVREHGFATQRGVDDDEQQRREGAAVHKSKMWPHQVDCSRSPMSEIGQNRTLSCFSNPPDLMQ